VNFGSAIGISALLSENAEMLDGLLGKESETAPQNVCVLGQQAHRGTSGQGLRNAASAISTNATALSIIVTPPGIHLPVVKKR
jgi:hypothetical protein